MVLPFQFGMPVFDPILILTMTLVMIVVMIESTGMFLALGEMTGKTVDQPALARGLRTDGLGTLIGGIFNTFPYTSFSQNVGLVAVTGVRSRFVCVAGGVILIVLGLLPKMAALVESLPTVVLGGAGLVMFGMVAATGIRILAGVDFKGNRYNALIVAISIGIGMIPLIAPQLQAVDAGVRRPASAAVTSRPSRSAISTSIRRMLQCQARASAGLVHTPFAGSAACVSTASRDGPPDFQKRGKPASGPSRARATNSCTA